MEKFNKRSEGRKFQIADITEYHSQLKLLHAQFKGGKILDKMRDIFKKKDNTSKEADITKQMEFMKRIEEEYISGCSNRNPGECGNGFLDRIVEIALTEECTCSTVERDGAYVTTIRNTDQMEIFSIRFRFSTERKSGTYIEEFRDLSQGRYTDLHKEALRFIRDFSQSEQYAHQYCLNTDSEKIDIAVKDREGLSRFFGERLIVNGRNPDIFFIDEAEEETLKRNRTAPATPSTVFRIYPTPSDPQYERVTICVAWADSTQIEIKAVSSGNDVIFRSLLTYGTYENIPAIQVLKYEKTCNRYSHIGTVMARYIKELAADNGFRRILVHPAASYIYLIHSGQPVTLDQDALERLYSEVMGAELVPNHCIRPFGSE